MSQPMHDKVCPLRGGQHAHERSVENLLSVPSTPTLANTFTLAYYEELLRVARDFDHWSVIAHLDLIRRYDPTPTGPMPFEDVRDITAEILKVAISRGRGIEVNTSGWRYGLGGPQPTEDVLRLYRDLGGTIVTIGSDSHKPSHLGSYLRIAKDLLRSVGFERFCTYKLMEPRFHEL